MPAQTQAPLPPCSLDAEEYVLGAMLLSATAIDAVAPILQPRDFYRESHARIYRAALELHQAGGGVDSLTVVDRLDALGQLDQVGGKERIREIATLVPAAGNAAYHAGIVAEMAELRDIIAFSERVGRLGWDREGSTEQIRATAREWLAGLDERRSGSSTLNVETWAEFERQAHDDIPTLIDQLWPEGGFGFIAAPPKKGKTWVALALSIAVASGRPLFDHFEIPHARPVLYVALEGHRAALRGRIGAIARGMGLNPDPDGPDLLNLHMLYKPAGINLADPAWAARLHQAADKVDAALVTIDVMRASARIKENDQEAFGSLRANLQPITDAGRAIAMLHHNVKLSEISKERDAGERMSGSGAMFGALDVGIYITGSENHARKLRIEFDVRDLATPNRINIELTGEGTAENGGFGYRDTATWEILTDEEVAEADLKASAEDIVDWLNENGGEATTTEIRLVFAIDIKTLRARHAKLMELGVEIIEARGKATRYVLTDPPEPEGELIEQMSMDPGNGTLGADPGTPRVNPDSQGQPHNHAPYSDTLGMAAEDSQGGLPGSGNGLNTSETTLGDPGTPKGVHAPARTGAHAPTPARAREAAAEPNGNGRYAEAEQLIRDELWKLPPIQVTETICERWPLIPLGTLKKLEQLAATLAADQPGEPAEPEQPADPTEPEPAAATDANDWGNA